MLKLTPCRYAFGENDRFADDRAFARVCVAVFFVERDLARFKHLLDYGQQFVARRADD